MHSVKRCPLKFTSTSDVISASRVVLPLPNVISFAIGLYCRNPSDSFSRVAEESEVQQNGAYQKKSEATCCQKNSNLCNVGVMKKV